MLLKIFLLVCIMKAMACRCPWSHYNITKNTKYIDLCEPDFTIFLSSNTSMYTQVAFQTRNQNLTTPFNLSVINFTRNGVTKLFTANRFHIHHISKHVLNGKLYDLELHVNHHFEEQDSNIIYAVFLEVHPGNFSDPFDDWELNTTVPVEQIFPFKLKTPRSALYYDDDPECNLNYKTAFYINTDILRVKQSNFEKVAKLIDLTLPPGDGVPVFIPKDQVCKLEKRPIRHRISNHKLRSHQ